MPPYLLDPLPSILMVQQPTDWTALTVSALSTLVGAAIGAGLGALFSYHATRRVNDEVRHREKLERLFFEVWSCRRRFEKMSRDVKKIAENSQRSAESMRDLRAYVGDLEPDIDNLVGLLHISMPEWDDKLSAFQDAAKAYAQHCVDMRRSIGGDGQADPEWLQGHKDKSQHLLSTLKGIYVPLAEEIRAVQN